MKFLKNDSNKDQNPYLITSNRAVEDFIEGTKVTLNLRMKQTPPLRNHKASEKEGKALGSLLSPTITIKPADKNLGIAILNSQDYVTQCLIHLSSKTYIRVAEFPNSNIRRSIENVLVNFRNQLTPHRCLYQYLQPPHSHTTPKFYGLPKIHKPLNEEGIPPVRPIISDVNSLLSRTAQFVDHVLQPLAQSYTDYIKNSTQLIQNLENTEIKEEVTLVTMDVVSLYPSIPQQECLGIIHSEMCKLSELIIFDPNLITQLLQVNMNNNFFTFADIPFRQIEGTAMGAAFSPSIANIYMSVFLRNFLLKRSDKPLLIKRYIDDIFMIWPKHHDLNNFISDINSYHPNIKFTFTQSDRAVDFLDITVYKGEDPTNTKKLLKVSTFQKENNLHQYLHFSSSHPKSVFKGIIIGEATRYVRTNSSEDGYMKQTKVFLNHLLNRDYPAKFIRKALKKVQYGKRSQYIQKVTQPSPQPIKRPILKCIPPPKYLLLKKIILNNFHTFNLDRYVANPLFITMKSKNLGDSIVKSNHRPTREDIDRILEQTRMEIEINGYNVTTPAPGTITKPHPCKHPRCATCQHFLPSPVIRSSHNGQCFRVRHPFTCNSSGIIYVITCIRCRKQYVGQTMKSLRERISQHRSSIKMNQPRYISKHFNLDGHNIQHLKVQIIDKVSENSGSVEALDKLERYWINKLGTIQPNGLNVNLSQSHTPCI